jgi:hypothetical protein
MENRRHSVELAEIFAVHHQEYMKHHELHPVQSKAYRAIMACRSSALGDTKAAVMDVDIPVRRTIHVVTDTVPNVSL